MSMDWANERYVRVYTRDTPDWLCLSFLAQGLFCLLLRKVSRAGILELGRAGRRGVFVAIGHAHQASLLEPALEELLADGCVQINGDNLVIPNFIEAQETPASDAQRAREHRARLRDGVTQPKRNVTPASRDPGPRDGPVTKRDATVTECNETVTNGHAASHGVTPNCAVPSRTVPNCAEPASHIGGPAGDEFLGGFRTKLAERLHLPEAVAIGKDRGHVLAFFREQIAAVGEDALLADCAEAAKKSESGTPSSLSWFVGWLQRLPVPKEIQ